MLSGDATRFNRKGTRGDGAACSPALVCLQHTVTGRCLPWPFSATPRSTRIKTQALARSHILRVCLSITASPSHRLVHRIPPSLATGPVTPRPTHIFFHPATPGPRRATKQCCPHHEGAVPRDPPPFLVPPSPSAGTRPEPPERRLSPAGGGTFSAAPAAAASGPLPLPAARQGPQGGES